MAIGLRIGGGRIPVGAIRGFIIGGMYGGIFGMPGRGGAMLGGGIDTPAGLLPGVGPAKGLFVIFPALNAAVVASIRCCACSSIHFW